MRLDFNVLWVEDQKDRVMSQCERIDLLVRMEGFRLVVEFASTLVEANKYLSDDIYGDHIDLILMDYDLGAGGQGDQGLEEVRKIFQFKDIIFYSAQTADLRKLVAERRMQGIFCSTRDELPDTVDGVFEALVKKVLDIDHSRGIVMGATSDIDHSVIDCLEKKFENSDDADREAALGIVQKHVKKKRNDFGKDIEKLSNVKNIIELQSLHHIYTSNDRLKLLKGMLDGGGDLQESIDTISSYLVDTVPKRNNLAHVRVDIEGFSRKLFDRDGNEITSDQMKTLRQELMSYQDHFEDLQMILNRTE